MKNFSKEHQIKVLTDVKLFESLVNGPTMRRWNVVCNILFSLSCLWPIVLPILAKDWIYMGIGIIATFPSIFITCVILSPIEKMVFRSVGLLTGSSGLFGSAGFETDGDKISVLKHLEKYRHLMPEQDFENLLKIVDQEKPNSCWWANLKKLLEVLAEEDKKASIGQALSHEVSRLKSLRLSSSEPNDVLKLSLDKR